MLCVKNGTHSERADQSGRVRHVGIGYYANVASQYQQTTVQCTKVDIEQKVLTGLWPQNTKGQLQRRI